MVRSSEVQLQVCHRQELAQRQVCSVGGHSEWILLARAHQLKMSDAPQHSFGVFNVPAMPACALAAYGAAKKKRVCFVDHCKSMQASCRS